MYKKGDLKHTIPRCQQSIDEDDDYCDSYLADDHRHSIYDNRTGKQAAVPSIYLPHSCSEWVIGGTEEVKAMIADLQDMLAQLTRESQTVRSFREGGEQESQQDR